jgi:hypothetical protein
MEGVPALEKSCGRCSCSGEALWKHHTEVRGSGGTRIGGGWQGTL